MEENKPLPAQEERKEDVIADYYDGVRELEMQDYETGIRKARTALFVVAGLVFLGEMISAWSLTGTLFNTVLGIALFEAGIFVALGFWTKKKPFSAIITGLILFVLLWVVTIVSVGSEAIYKGIIVKIIVISVLVNAIKPAKAWEDAKKNKI